MNQREARIHIRNARPVTSGALRGRAGGNHAPGKLEDGCLTRYMENVACGTIAYTVFSYDTPIAYLDYTGWVLLTQRHSQTTSRHQTLVRQALVGKDVEEVAP